MLKRKHTLHESQVTKGCGVVTKLLRGLLPRSFKRFAVVLIKSLTFEILRRMYDSPFATQAPYFEGQLNTHLL